jgi:hypothetical protein
MALRQGSSITSLELHKCSFPEGGSENVSSLLLALGMNQTLRKLHVSEFSSGGGSLIPALREGLEKNSTLEMLELIQGCRRDETHLNSFHIAVVEALQLNKTLKTLRLCDGTSTLTNDQAQHLISVAKKNYGLESIPIFDLESRMEDLRSILRLNGAGRGYLLDGQGSVVSKESVY